MQEITMIKNTFFNFKVKIDIKTTTTTVIKNELKYSPMSEGNTCNAKPNLGVLPFTLYSMGGRKGPLPVSSYDHIYITIWVTW